MFFVENCFLLIDLFWVPYVPLRTFIWRHFHVYKEKVGQSKLQRVYLQKTMIKSLTVDVKHFKLAGLTESCVRYQCVIICDDLDSSLYCSSLLAWSLSGAYQAAWWTVQLRRQRYQNARSKVWTKQTFSYFCPPDPLTPEYFRFMFNGHALNSLCCKCGSDQM